MRSACTDFSQTNYINGLYKIPQLLWTHTIYPDNREERYTADSKI